MNTSTSSSAIRHAAGAVLAIALLAVASAEAASFAGLQTGPNEWTYSLTFDPLDNYAVCPSPGDVATITLSGLAGVVSATAPTSTDFPPGVDALNLLWVPAVSGGGTIATWTHSGPGTGNFSDQRHVFGFKVFTATPALNGTVNVASDGFSFDVSRGPCPVEPADDRDFTGTTNGPVGPPRAADDQQVVRRREYRSEWSDLADVHNYEPEQRNHVDGRWLRRHVAE